MRGPEKAACLATPRLNLRIVGQDDRADMFATMNAEHTAAMVSFLSWPMTLDQAQTMVDRAIAGWQEDSEFLYLAHTKEGALAGYIGCHRRPGHVAEIGYWICEAQQRQGYAGEMLEAVAAMAFNVLNVAKVYSTVAHGNPASVRVLEKTGFVRSGEKDAPTPDGGRRPSLLFERYR